MRKYIVLYFLCLLLPVSVYADCIACYSLYGVKIITFNGDTVIGYAKWNDTWADVNDEERILNYKFPEKMMNHLAAEKISNLILIRNVYVCKYPFKNAFVITRDCIDTIKISTIKSISARPDKLEWVSGAGEIPMVLNSTVKLLLTKPFAQLYTESLGGATDSYLLSYNKHVAIDSLERLLKQPKYIYNHLLELEKEKVIVLSYSWD
jgi:hypothetical protein